MTLSVNEAYTSIEERVIYWAKNLVDIIKEVRDNGHEPILIALSRKMPRFLDWIIATHANGTISPELIKQIASVELTTELAIPFIFQSRNGSECEFIILDDIIIFGSTLRRVSENLNFLYHRDSHISCMLRRKDSGKLDYVIQRELHNIPGAEDKETNLFIDAISTIVEYTQLPIDMEFPVFTIERECEEDDDFMVKSIIQESLNNGILPYPISNRNDRFSIDLTEGNTIGANNDFSKIRFFSNNYDEDHENLVFEVISPMILSQSDLLSIDKVLFDNSYYQRIWNLSTYGIRLYLQTYLPEENLLGWSKLKTDFVRSLCVWASYLFSLSSFIKNAQKIIPESFLDIVYLKQSDLVLILGEIEANAIYHELVTMIKSNIVSVSFKTKVLGIPKSFAPVPFQNELRSTKILKAILADSVSEVFEEIFKYQHYSNPKFSNRYIIHERPFFGETYDSLTEAVQPYFHGTGYVEKLHEWIDANIDSGYVVPKYESVNDDTGSIYWRRYFHPGIRCYKKSHAN